MFAPAFSDVPVAAGGGAAGLLQFGQGASARTEHPVGGAR